MCDILIHVLHRNSSHHRETNNDLMVPRASNFDEKNKPTICDGFSTFADSSKFCPIFRVGDRK